jgi:cytochrome c oxidase subunit 2
MRRQFAQTILFLLMSVLSCSASAAFGFNLPEGVTPISHDLYRLHMIIFWVVVAIGVVVFSVLFYAIIMHRKSRGHVAATFHEHPVLEVTWAIIPLIILIVMAIPATKVLFRMSDTGEAQVNIKVTGYQWKWKYDYLDDGISFFSNLATSHDKINNLSPKDENYLLDVDKPLVVPTGQKIRFLFTGNDVVHSWWVPELGIKQDAIPGYIRERATVIEKPGTYRGQCAELCGSNHGFMPIVVVAKNPDDYQQWLKEQKGQQAQTRSPLGDTANTPPVKMNKEELMHQGKKVYDAHCVACHQANGEGIPQVFKAIKGSPIVQGPANIHIGRVVNGVKGTAMQAFGSQLSDIEIAAVITYQRNSFGNHTNDVVQPADVQLFKQKEGH